MSESSEHPPRHPGEPTGDPELVGESLGSTRPLVNFDADDAASAAQPAPDASGETPERRGGSRLFPQLPDDPRLAGQRAAPTGEPAETERVGQDAAHATDEASEPDLSASSAPAEGLAESSGPYEPLFDSAADSAAAESGTAVAPEIPRADAESAPAEASTALPPGAGAVFASAARPAPVVATAAAQVPSEAGTATSESDRFAQWARLDASASHWREGNQDYEERGVVSDEARTVLHSDTSDSGGSGRNLPAAIAVGAVLAALFFGALRLGEAATVALVVIVLVLAAAEFYRAARPLGYRPATLAGLAGVAGLTVAVHLRGVEAYPIVLAVSAVTIFCWFLFGVERDHPTANMAITMLGLLWVGGLGSFAALMLREPNGDSMLIGAVIGTVAYDVGGYIVGRTTGQSRLSSRISPNKTHEGLIGGIVLSVVITTLVLNRFPGVFPWTGSLLDALWLCVAVALAAPLGDLTQSMVKRDATVKDMGSLLPGHGGVFDRFDALLFSLPAAYFVGTYVLG